jgi:hypothetical protein
MRIGIAKAGVAVARVTTRDAGPAQVVAMLVGGAAFLASALDAPAPVGSAVETQRRVFTLPIFVARITHHALLVAAVRIGRTREVVATRLEAVVGDAITAKVRWTVVGEQALHAAVQRRLAARPPARRAVGITGALHTRAADATEPARASRTRPTNLRSAACSATAGRGASLTCSPASSAVRASGRPAASGATARNVVLEALVARARAQTACRDQ